MFLTILPCCQSWQSRLARGFATIAAGHASIWNSETRRGSSARSRRRSTPSRSRRSARRRACRSRPARAFEPERRCRIRGTGRPYVSSSLPERKGKNLQARPSRSLETEVIACMGSRAVWIALATFALCCGVATAQEQGVDAIRKLAFLAGSWHCVVQGAKVPSGDAERISYEFAPDWSWMVERSNLRETVKSDGVSSFGDMTHNARD